MKVYVVKAVKQSTLEEEVIIIYDQRTKADNHIGRDNQIYLNKGWYLKVDEHQVC